MPENFGPLPRWPWVVTWVGLIAATLAVWGFAAYVIVRILNG